MNIALMAHDSKKELMVQFSTAYSGVLKKHNLCGTAITGKVITEATDLVMTTFLSGAHGGDQQISSRIACGEIDILFFFRDPNNQSENHDSENKLLRMCDSQNIPCATNIATGDALIHALERGDLDWMNILKFQV